MNAHTEKLLDHLAKSRNILHTAVDAVPSELRDQRPRPDSWSVAEILEHLNIVDTRFTALWRMKSAGTPALNGRVPEITFDPERVRDRTKKAEATGPIRPTGAVEAATARTTLEVTRQHLKDAIAEADARDLSRVLHPHPLFGELNLYQWVLFLASHEERHAAQIREIVS